MPKYYEQIDRERMLEKASRYMSKLLRHDPETLKMDKAGWVDSLELCEFLNIDMIGLNWIVETNNKKRFVFNEDKSKIRAAQGHSKGVADDKEYTRLTAVQEDFELYHGTDADTAELIKNSSILPGKRQYVHWTKDVTLATKRAKQRSGKSPVLVVLKVKSYLNNKGKLHISENEVYLTPEIEGKFMEYRSAL